MSDATHDRVSEWVRREYEDLISTPANEFSAGRGRTLTRLAKFLGIEADLHELDAFYAED
jgi:hypothetical protein